MQGLRSLTAIAAAVAAAAAVPTAEADVVDWIHASGDVLDWDDPRNWSTGIVPGEGDTARFGFSGPPEAFFTVASIEAAPDPVDRLVFGARNTWLVIQSPEPLRAFTGSALEPALVVGGDGPVIARIGDGVPIDGVPALQVSSALIGAGDGFASLVVSGGSTTGGTSLLVEDTLEIGRSGNARLQVGSLAEVRAGRILMGTGGDALADPENSIGRLVADNGLDVGVTSTAEIRELELEAGSLAVSLLPGSYGSVTGNRTIEVAGQADIGIRDLAWFEPGDVTVGGDLVIGVDAPKPGTPGWPVQGLGYGIADFTDRTVAIGGDFVIGLVGAADLTVNESTSVTAGGEILSFNAVNPFAVALSSLRVELSGGPGPIASEPIFRAVGDILLPEITLAFDDDIVAGTRWALAETEGGMLVPPPILVPPIPEGLELRILLEDEIRLVAWIVEPASFEPDIDGDGIVGLTDLLIVLSNFGPCPPITDCPPDVDGDRLIGLSDILEILAAWS